MEQPLKTDLKQQLLEAATFRVDTELNNKVDVLRKEEVMRRMEVRYQKYYKHWRDFDMLTTILAMIGLILAVVEVRYFRYKTLLQLFYIT